MTTKTELEQLLIDEGAKILKSCKPEDQTDVYKAVSAFYLGIAKQGAKTPPPSGSGKFADVKARALAGGNQTEGHA